MEFYEKLNFLLNITNTSNIELAKSIEMKPSIISLYKTGKRKMPKKEATLRSISDYFSKKMTTDYQKQALSQYVDNPYITEVEDTNQLADEIFNWFYDRKATSTTAVEILMNVNQKPHLLKDDSQFTSHNIEDEESFYQLLLEMQQIEKPKIFYVQFDDDLTWYFTSQKNNEMFKKTIQILISKGCKIIQFLPPSSHPYLEYVFNQWIPFYLTDHVEAYYYPRIRDVTFRNHILLLDNTMSLFSLSILSGSTSRLGTISRNPLSNRSLQNVLEDYKKICTPAFTIIHNQEIIEQKMRKMYFGDYDRTFVRLTLPIELAPQAIRDQMKNEHVYNQQHLSEGILQKSTSNSFLDICPLYTKYEILNKKAVLQYVGMEMEKYPVYTMESYCEHLQSIVDEMEKNPNYTFIPANRIIKLYPILIQSRSKALIVRNINDKLSLFEINNPDLVIILEEYIQQEIDKKIKGTDIHKEAITQLKNYIEELQKK